MNSEHIGTNENNINTKDHKQSSSKSSNSGNGKGWHEHHGLAVAMPVDNIDTDQIIPARFMSRTRAEGYADVLFNDIRTADHGTQNKQFILDQHPEASVLVAGRNFGSGSSREAAVYALVDAGIKAVIAPGFGDIFAANAVNNGLLPAQVDSTIFERLLSYLNESARPMHICLQERSIGFDERALPFMLDDTKLQKLINGWDDIDLTQVHKPAIEIYSATRQRDVSWAWPENPQRQ